MASEPRLVEPRAAAELRDRVEQADEAARGQDRGGVVGGLAAGRQPHRLGADVGGQLGQQRHQRLVALERDGRAARAPRGDRSRSAKATSGWKLAADVPAARAGASTDAGSAPLVCTIPWPAVEPDRRGHAGDGVVGHGQEHEVDVVDQRGRACSTARAPGTSAGEPLPPRRVPADDRPRPASRPG